MFQILIEEMKEINKMVNNKRFLLLIQYNKKEMFKISSLNFIFNEILLFKYEISNIHIFNNFDFKIL